MNVFKKCLRREFGKSKYMDYVQMCEEEILKHRNDPSKMEDRKIFIDMYEFLKKKNDKDIDEKTEKLSEVLFTAIQIGRKFTSVLMFYI